MDYGMSELGRISYRESSRAVFLSGAPEERAHSHSERTAQQIDTAVRRVIDAALEKVREILHQRRDALVALAEELMVVESVDAQQLQKILAENSDSPRVVPGTTGGSKRFPDASDEPREETRGSANH
jgi:cell division protease FtsH